jgi:hypothetical protein
MKHFESYNSKKSASSAKERSRDPVFFVDLPFVLDWTKWFEDMDPSLSLNVKNTLANRCFYFERIGSNVVTSCRAYASANGDTLPIILPDYNSNYFKLHPREVAASELTEEERLGGEILHDLYSNVTLGNSNSQQLNDKSCDSYENDDEELQSNSSSSLEKPNYNDDNKLGLKAFKIVNNETKLNFNLSSSREKEIEIADFEESKRAHLPYSYAKSVLNSAEITEDRKQDIKKWLDEDLPKPPTDNQSGFPKGSSLSYCLSRDSNYENVLQRVRKLSKLVKRPDPKEYQLQKLDGDAILDDLPTVQYTTTVSNAETENRVWLNKAIMEATLQNDVEKAKQVIIREYEEKKKLEAAEKKQKAAEKRQLAAETTLQAGTVEKRSAKKKQANGKKAAKLTQLERELEMQIAENESVHDSDQDTCSEPDMNSECDTTTAAPKSSTDDFASYWGSNNASGHEPFEALTYPKKFKCLNILPTTNIVVNETFVKLKSASHSKISTNAIGIVVKDYFERRNRIIGVKFQNISNDYEFGYNDLYLVLRED